MAPNELTITIEFDDTLKDKIREWIKEDFIEKEKLRALPKKLYESTNKIEPSSSKQKEYSCEFWRGFNTALNRVIRELKL